jgi:hypothetical protein
MPANNPAGYKKPAKVSNVKKSSAKSAVKITRKQK